MISVALFVRVSSKSQEYDRQIVDLTEYAKKMQYEIVSIIAEKISGTRRNDQRSGIKELLDLCRAKKVQKILVSEVSRIGRRPSDTLKLLEELTDLKISVYSQNFGLETLLPTGKINPAASLIFTIYAEIARMEIETHVDRVKSGQQEAKRKGKHIGRLKGSVKPAKALVKENPVIVRKLNEGLSIRDIAKIVGCGTAKVQRIKKAIQITN